MNVWAIIVSGVTYGALFSIVSMSITFVYRATKLFNFATGAFVVLAGYLLYALVSLDINYWISMGLAILATTMVSGLYYWLGPWQMIRAPHWTVIVSTLGFAILLEGAMGAIWLGRTYSVPRPYEIELLSVGFGASVASIDLYTLMTMLVIAVALLALLGSKTYGARFSASSFNVTVAGARGVSPFRYYLFAWLIGGGLAGVAGVIFASTQAAGLSAATVGFAAFPAAVMGGLDSVLGSAVAGSLLGIVYLISSLYLSSQAFNAIAFGATVLLLLVRPHGLFGSREVARV